MRLLPLLIACMAFVFFASAQVAMFGSPGPKTNFWLVRTDLEGKVLCWKTYQWSLWDRCNTAIRTQGGGFALAGETGWTGDSRHHVWP